MNSEETANKEYEVFQWLTKKGYDRRASKDIAPIIVAYLEDLEKNSCTCGGFPECICDIVKQRIINQPKP